MSRRALVLALLAGGLAEAAPPVPVEAERPAPVLPPQTIGLLVGLGELGSPGGGGAVFTLGLRYAPWRHAALALDLGYGVLAAGPTVQDRWWILPTVAAVVPVGPLRLELGAGLGLGAASGYLSAGAYADAPFTPVWAFQLVPAARAHATLWAPLGRRADLFFRIEAGGLLLDGNAIGSRAGNPNPTFADVTWGGLTVGVALRLL
jgi:hypothetical protein